MRTKNITFRRVSAAEAAKIALQESSAKNDANEPGRGGKRSDSGYSMPGDERYSASSTVPEDDIPDWTAAELDELELSGFFTECGRRQDGESSERDSTSSSPPIIGDPSGGSIPVQGDSKPGEDGTDWDLGEYCYSDYDDTQDSSWDHVGTPGTVKTYLDSGADDRGYIPQFRTRYFKENEPFCWTRGVNQALRVPDFSEDTSVVSVVLTTTFDGGVRAPAARAKLRSCIQAALDGPLAAMSAAAEQCLQDNNVVGEWAVLWINSFPACSPFYMLYPCCHPAISSKK